MKRRRFLLMIIIVCGLGVGGSLYGCGALDDCGSECIRKCGNSSQMLCTGQEDLGNGMLECHCWDGKM